MIIPCLRCGKEIDTPNVSNADYVIADVMVVREPRETLVALKHNQATLAKKAKMAETEKYLAEDGVTELIRPKYPGLTIDDSEYDAIEIPNFEASKTIGEGLVKIIAEIREKDIQKTGIICPDCHKDTDFVIWGVHRSRQQNVLRDTKN